MPTEQITYLTKDGLDTRIEDVAHELIDTHIQDQRDGADESAAQAQYDTDSPLVMAFKALDGETLADKVIKVDGDKLAAMSLEDFGKHLEATQTQITAPIERAIPSISGVNVGSLLVGVGAGVTLGEIVDAFVAPTEGDGSASFTNSAVKGVVAISLTMFGNRLMTRPATNAAVAALAVQIASNHIDFRRFANNIAGAFRGDSADSGLRQAEAVARAHQARLPEDIGGVGDDVNDVFG